MNPSRQRWWFAAEVKKLMNPVDNCFKYGQRKGMNLVEQDVYLWNLEQFVEICQTSHGSSEWCRLIAVIYKSDIVTLSLSSWVNYIVKVKTIQSLLRDCLWAPGDNVDSSQIKTCKDSDVLTSDIVFNAYIEVSCLRVYWKKNNSATEKSLLLS